MSSKINALHWMAYHQDESDWQFIQRTNPLSVKIFQDHWRDPFFLERLYATAPRALILLRDHPLSEEKDAMTADPVGTGKRHANTWIDAAARMMDVKGFDPGRTVFLGINEPGVGTPQQVEAVVAYTVAFLDQLATYGWRGGALSLSVGWPANTGKDTPVDWEPFAPVRDAIQRGNHLLILHEYFANWQGVNLNRGWWVDRLGQCPWQVSIIVGEAGADNYVDYTWASQHFDEHRRGWAGHQNIEQYVAALAEVDAIYRADHRVHSAMPFSYDFAHPWGSFDVRPIREQLATYYSSVSGEVAPLAVPRYPDKVTPPAPPAPPAPPPGPAMFEAWLREQGAAAAVVPVTPGFALYDAILDDGLFPNGPEVRASFDGHAYTLRSAEHPTDPAGARYTYYVEVPAPGQPWRGVKRLLRGGREHPAPPTTPPAPTIIERPSPNHDARPDSPVGRVSAIVLHATAGSAGASLSWLVNPASGASTHYLIAKDGRTWRLVQDTRRAWHAGTSDYLGRDDWNDFSLGIELENDNDGRDPYPAVQLATTVALLRWLVWRHGIRREWVATHGQVAIPPGRKTDPRGLDVAALLAEVYLDAVEKR